LFDHLRVVHPQVIQNQEYLLVLLARQPIKEGGQYLCIRTLGEWPSSQTVLYQNSHPWMSGRNGACLAGIQQCHAAANLVTLHLLHEPAVLHRTLFP
jgi:hypothetical protein